MTDAPTPTAPETDELDGVMHPILAMLEQFEGEPEDRHAVKQSVDTICADLIALRAEVATLRASEARMREALERTDRALKPFADTVFNDNGDCTISDTYLLTDVDFCNAYSARNIARAALQGETK